MSFRRKNAVMCTLVSGRENRLHHAGPERNKHMTLNIGKEVSALGKMTVPELRARYAEVAGEATSSRHKEYLIRRIIWRMQANEEGGLSERARQRATELAAGADVRLTPPRLRPAESPHVLVGRIPLSDGNRLPMPEAIVAREYKGRMIEVHVLPNGFEFEGDIYRSLSAIARKVTGTHWNGYHFFKLSRKGHDGNER